MTGKATKKNISSRAVKCPNCGGAIKIEAAGRSVSLGCRFCGTILDITGEDAVIFNEYTKLLADKPRPIVPLASKWKFEGIEWKFIGFVQKCDRSGIYTWREYILVNPMHGQSWLVEFNNHWIFLKRLRSMPVGVADGYRDKNNRRYRTFQTGSATVQYVVGEFPWRVRYGDKTETLDAVAPPFILSMERDSQEISWTTGMYISPEAVKEGFGTLLKGMRPPIGIHPAQPNPNSANAISSTRIAWVATAAMAGVAIQAGALKGSTLLLSQPFEFESGNEAPVELLSEPFQLSGLSFLNSRIDADLDNSWMEAEMELLPVPDPEFSSALEADPTDERESIEYTQGIEYYHGVDGGESWSEGSLSDSGQIGGVPKGWWRARIKLLGKSDRIFVGINRPDYRYINGQVVDLNAGKRPPSGPKMSGKIILSQKPFLMSQFMGFLCLIWVWPLLTQFLRWGFEKKRWEDAS